MSVCVLWNGHKSDVFCLSTGVLQGGVLSPVFFIVYIDDFYSALNSKAAGCFVANVFLGLVGFADDHVILAPTLGVLVEALKIITDVARTLNINFNPDKSCFIKFSKDIFRHFSIPVK